MISSQRYDQRGVSASKDDVHNAIKNIDKGIFPKALRTKANALWQLEPNPEAVKIAKPTSAETHAAVSVSVVLIGQPPSAV